MFISSNLSLGEIVEDERRSPKYIPTPANDAARFNEKPLSNCNPIAFKKRWSFNMFLMYEKPKGLQSLMA